MFDFAALQGIALRVAEARSVETVLSAIVRGLVDQSGIALARVWLCEPGDICQTCPMRSECLDQSRCLHLVASAGKPLTESSTSTTTLGDGAWSNTSGSFRRFPLGVRKIGHVGAGRGGLLIPNVLRDKQWIATPTWAASEGILSFAGQPLQFRGETVGVLGIFSREEISSEAFNWLRTFADQAAIAIANANAFTEIQHLREQLQRENEFLHEELRFVQGFGDIVGDSLALTKSLKQVELVAPTVASVLIEGESGTGKELIARAIHERSARKNKPLVKVNCSAIPHELFESEFFGHVKGAFTGAIKDRVGRFQLADGGTLFLDEVGEIPLELQSKLLRVLQEGEFERIGDERTRKVDVRVIAATNRNLKEEAEAHRFRLDLYFRLSVFPIEIPPLRDRPEDIPVLAQYFAQQAGRKHKLPIPALSQKSMEQLLVYAWPGNVRELQHVVERSIISHRTGPLQFLLPAQVVPKAPSPRVASRTSAAILSESDLKDIERRNIEQALEQCRWRVHGSAGAAALLGTKPTTLISRMKAMGLRRKEDM
jgi:transcriptional regulator with GAF, ATPase, and Fis domain